MDNIIKAMVEQFQNKIALAAAEAQPRRKGVNAIYLRCQASERASERAPELARARAKLACNFKHKML